MKRFFFFFKGISSITFFGSIQYSRDQKDLTRTIRSFNETQVNYIYVTSIFKNK